MASVPESISVERVVFEDAQTAIPGVRTEYRFDGPRLQVHFFPEGEKFPEEFGAKVAWAVSSMNDPIVDFVGEVNSWYLEVPKVAMPGSFAAESIFKKVAGRMVDA